MAIILVAILLFGAGLRWFQLGAPSYWMDEGFSIATAQQWLIDGDWVRSPLYHALLAAVGTLVDWDGWWLRSLSVVLGLLMIVAGYFTVRRWFNSQVAIVCSSLLSVVTLEIAWSRQVRMYILLQLVFWLGLYTYHQWRQHQLHWMWPLICVVITLLSHELGIFLMIAYLWYELSKRLKRLSVVSILISLGITYGIYHLCFPAAPYVNYWWHYWYWIVTNYSVLLPLAVLGIWKSRQRHQLVQWLVAVWLSWLWCLSFIVPLLQYRYLIMTFPIVLLLASLGLYWLWEKGWIGKCVVGAAIGLMIWLQQITVSPRAFYSLESDTPDAPFSYKSFTPQPDFKSVYQFVDQYIAAHPETKIVDAYPMLHQLYRNILPNAAAYINLTGSSDVTTPPVERYTQLQHLTTAQLQQWSEQGEVLIIVDDFATYRLDPEIRPVLTDADLIWQAKQAPWSTITVYRLKQL